MKSQEGSFEVKGFVDVAIYLVDIDKLSLAKTIADPSVADGLNLNSPPCVALKPFNKFVALAGIFEDIKAVSFFDICSAGEYFPIIFQKFAGQITELNFFLLGAFDVESMPLEDGALEFLSGFDGAGMFGF